MSSALEDLADAADEVANEQRLVARKARGMQRRRDRGESWQNILDHERDPDLVALLRRSGRRLSTATAAFARRLAIALSDEGVSRRRIAARLGVTHQRVSAILQDTRQRTGGQLDQSGE